MLNTKRTYNGMVVAPHHLASQAGLRVLREGGNAVEAMIASASTIAVVYPHMNGLGGDNFWLIHKSGKPVTAIDACGAAAGAACIKFYEQLGYSAIPERGPLAALTMAGAVSGWQNALQYSQQVLNGKMPLSRLLEDAIYYAKNGVAVTHTLANNLAVKLPQLQNQPGFATTYLAEGRPLVEGQRLLQTQLACTLDTLARHGLEDFYRGDISRQLATELEQIGSPIRHDDFTHHHAITPTPLSLPVSGHTVYNLPPPTQGLASLILLGVYDRLKIKTLDSFDYIHAIVEASKCAFRVRDKHVTDPAYMQNLPGDFLRDDSLQALAATIDPTTASPWPEPSQTGDTVWLDAVDKMGCAVSFIQSVYWEFGAGVVLPGSGITWQNRGISFSLDRQHHNALQPYRRPFHTIQPALAQLTDGRIMVYGTMGGEGQPQTQAMIFTRHVLHNVPIQLALSAPRWLLGRTWGSEITNLRMENRFNSDVYAQLRAAGHDVDIVGSYEEIMGHAGAIVIHPDGLIEAGADPRSDGSATGF